jgi:hypothetical protein
MKKQFLLFASFLIAGLAAFAQVSSADGTFSADTGFDMSLLTNNLFRITILNTNGRVGVGTPSPSDMLHVIGNARADQFNSVNGIFNTIGSTNLSFNINNSNRISVLASNGYVGINKTTPSYQLDVNGTINATSFLLNGTEQRSSQWANTAADIYFNTGNVGLGILAPEAKLHIKDGNLLLDNGSTPAILTGTGTAELNRYVQLLNSTGLQTPSGLKAGGVLVADTYSYASPSKNDLIVKGKVAIGTPLTANPNNYTLAVNGKIGAKDVQVETSSTTWPDYVFAQDYRLPSLAEVEKFIQENKHLENVPSASEIAKDGHSLGEMDKILLMKIEELTMYLIQQQKEIEELKKKIEKK